MIDIAVHFGRTPSEVDTQHVGVAHWVDLGVLGDRNHRLRIFCTTAEAAEALADAFWQETSTGSSVALERLLESLRKGAAHRPISRSVC